MEEIRKLRKELQKELLSEASNEERIAQLNQQLLELKLRVKDPVELAKVQQVLDEAQAKIEREQPIKVHITN